jgi:hypothetical protein
MSIQLLLYILVQYSLQARNLKKFPKNILKITATVGNDVSFSKTNIETLSHINNLIYATIVS